MESLTSFEQLAAHWKPLQTEELIESAKTEHLAKGSRDKNLRYREFLLRHTDLEQKIKDVLTIFKEQNIPLPFTHITSKAQKFKNGESVSTGFVESIQSEGFKIHTNVGSFVKRGHKTELADAQYFINNPHMFIRSVDDLIKQYVHHGYRTNKQILGQDRDKGIGIPVMFLVDGSVNVRRGTDYHDHHILSEPVLPDRILGVIELEGKNRNKEDDMNYIVDAMLRTMESTIQSERNENPDIALTI